MRRNIYCRNMGVRSNMSKRSTSHQKRVVIHLFRDDQETPLTPATVLRCAAIKTDCLVREMNAIQIRRACISSPCVFRLLRACMVTLRVW